MNMAKYEIALKFYSDENLYDYYINHNYAELMGGEILKDEGKTARKALEVGTLEAYKKALEFYSNEDLYEFYLTYDMAELTDCDIMRDEGAIARKTLRVN